MALEDNAARAGFAFVCCYASAAEYEAELIAARRALGAYRPKRRRHLLLAAAVAAFVIVIVLA